MTKTSRRTPIVTASLALSATLSLATPARATFTAFNPTGQVQANGNGNDGLFFTPTTNITVSTLGYFNGGFSESHPVAIFDAATQSILAQATVTASSTLVGSYRYEPISALSLQANHQYAVVGLDGFATNTDTTIVAALSSMNAGSAVHFDAYFYNYEHTLSFPTISYGTAYATPNFQYATSAGGGAAVPEPAMATALASAGTLAMRRRRR